MRMNITESISSQSILFYNTKDNVTVKKINVCFFEYNQVTWQNTFPRSKITEYMVLL